MPVGPEITAIVSYTILAFSAVFGMYNTIMYLYLSGEKSKSTLMLTAVWQYLKGAFYGGLILQLAIILFAIIFAIWERQREFKLVKFVKDVNINIAKILKFVLKIMLLTNDPPKF